MKWPSGVTNVKAFGASPTASAATNSAAIAAAAAAAGPNGTVYIPAGTYAINLDQITFLGHVYAPGATLTTTQTGAGVALTLGDGPTSYPLKTMVLPAVTYTGAGLLSTWQVGSIGIKLWGIYSSEISNITVNGFETGLWTTSGTAATSFNQLFLNTLVNNKVNLLIQDGANFNTECIYYGGRFSWNAGYGSNVAGCRSVYIKTATVTANNNHHKFYGASFEGEAKANNQDIFCEGSQNVWHWCRFESTAPGAVFDTSNAYDNLITGAYDIPMAQTNSAKLNRLETTRHAIHYGAGSPIDTVTAYKGALYLRNDGNVGTSLYSKEFSNNGTDGWVPVGDGVTFLNSNHTAAAAEKTLKYTGTWTLTLPSAVTYPGKLWRIKNAGVGTITLATTSSQTIDGSAPGTVAAGEVYAVQSDGANYIVVDAHTGLQKTSEKDQAGGYASLDGSGKVPTAELPALAITDTFPVASQAAMLALTAEVGDVAIRSDLNKTFILRVEPATVLGNWSELLTPTDAVLSVNSKTGAVSLVHSDLGSIGTDDHHAQGHSHASHTGIGTDDHHAKVHAQTDHPDITTPSVLGRHTAATGPIEVCTMAQLKTMLALAAGDVSGLATVATTGAASDLSGTLAAARLPALSGDVKSSAGSGSLSVAQRTFVPGSGNSLLGSSGDFAGIFTGQFLILTTNGRHWFARVEWPKTQTVSNFNYIVNVLGGTLTSGQCFVSLYNSAGQLQCYSADQSGVWGSTAILDAITVTPVAKDGSNSAVSSVSVVSSGPGDFVWVSFVFNGTTGPKLRVVGANVAAAFTNHGCSAAQYRAAFQSLTANLTAPPGSITPGSMTARAEIVGVSLT